MFLDKKEEYEHGALMRPQGWYSFIRRNSDKKEVYSKRFEDEDSALQDSFRAWKNFSKAP
jgi:hypothetical protein